MIKKLLLAFLLCLVPVNAWAVELLVQAQSHWQDSFKQSDVDALTTRDKDNFDARTQIGDIVVVRPDGWKWGKEETLPRFVIIKIPSISIEQSKKFEDALQDFTEPTNPKTLKVRKWQIPQATILNAVSQNTPVISVDAGTAATFIGTIEDKKQ